MAATSQLQLHLKCDASSPLLLLSEPSTVMKMRHAVVTYVIFRSRDGDNVRKSNQRLYLCTFCTGISSESGVDTESSVSKQLWFTFTGKLLIFNSAGDNQGIQSKQSGFESSCWIMRVPHPPNKGTYFKQVDNKSQTVNLDSNTAVYHLFVGLPLLSL